MSAVSPLPQPPIWSLVLVNGSQGPLGLSFDFRLLTLRVMVFSSWTKYLSYWNNLSSSVQGLQYEVFVLWGTWCGHLQAVSTVLWLRQDKFTQTTESYGGKRTEWPLSQEESVPTLALTGFYWLNLHRNTGHIYKAHQSLSGRNDQILDNIQRILRVYSESGSDS